MKKAFRDAYNTELALLKERSREFAADYPGLADRLGGLLDENLDPAVAGLLEGTAFLAARVQLNMQEEFRTFTYELLEQVFPDALAPTPSVMLAQATVSYDASGIEEGLTFEAGEYIDARYTDADKRISCRYQITEPLTLWPLALTGLSYFPGTGPLGALGQDIADGTKAGLSIELARVDGSGKPGSEPIGTLPIDDLPIHFIGPFADAVSLYEQVHCRTTRISLRYLDKNGDPVFRRIPPDAIEQIGFERDHWLLPHDGRLFDGFATLREAFVFPRKFLGLRLTGLRTLLRGIRTSTVQIVFEFSAPDQGLASRLEPDHLGLHAVPAVNLFEEHSSQVRLDNKRHEFVVTPDSSPMTHYEIYKLTDVFAHYSGNRGKIPVHPLYALPPEGQSPRQTLYYTTRRKPRRLTDKERRYGASRYRYRGTETFISVYEPPDAEPAQRLQIKALCSNRHLPEYLPIAQGKNDFFMSNDQTVTLSCVAGPTLPREPLNEIEIGASHRNTAGDNYWRLLSYLSLSHFGLESRTDGEGAAPMRELLSLFVTPSDTFSEAQIEGLRDVKTRPITRTVARPDGYHPARGLEVRLVFDEDEFEGSGAILMGAILDRFVSEYAAVNSFTQCVVETVQRGVIKTWPPRSGSGPLI